MATVYKDKNINIDVLRLINGFIRNVHLKHNKLIPLEITQIIIKFYDSKSKIIFFKYNDINIPPTICVYDFEQNKNHQFNMKLLDSSIRDIRYKLTASAGICFVKDFKIPQKLLPKNSMLNANRLYDVLLSAQYGNQQCGAFILDSKDSFYWKLPSFSVNVGGSYLVYSSKWGLISVGRFNQVCGFHILRFDEEEIATNEWKWKGSWTDIQSNRACLCAQMATKDKLICCGGTLYQRHADLYDFNTKTRTQLADLIDERAYSGIYVDEFKNENVYIGGGRHATQKIEYINLTKNRWTPLSDTNGIHRIWPIIWKDDVNIINIASPWCKMWEKMDLRENKWNIHVQQQSFDNLFGISIPQNSSTRLLI